MAKGGKLTKLIKKLSFGKTTKTNTSFSSSTTLSSSSLRSDASETTPSTTLHPVYVGKSRRQYFLSSDVVGHPLVQQLAGKSTGEDDIITVVGCEVVMFEHLLWMLDNADLMPESMDELVDYYAC